MKSSEFGMQVYLRPFLSQLSLRPARSHLLNHARHLVQMILGGRRKEKEPLAREPQYQPPQMTKLTPEQAKLKLLGCLSVGEQGAKDLLDLLFAGPAATDAFQQQPKPAPENSLGVG